jgi:hypothetical protein
MHNHQLQWAALIEAAGIRASDQTATDAQKEGSGRGVAFVNRTEPC